MPKFIIEQIHHVDDHYPTRHNFIGLEVVPHNNFRQISNTGWFTGRITTVADGTEISFYAVRVAVKYPTE